MPDVLNKVILVVVLILANGVFATAEIAMIKARRTRLAEKAKAGERNAQIALELGKAPNRFLSTIQIGISLVGVLAGAVGGADISAPLADALTQVEFIAPYSETVALVLVVGGITYLSLIVGELVPKRLALNSPERLATTLARPMRALSVIASPAVKVLAHSTELMLRLLGVEPSEEPAITEEEIEVFLEQGTQAGALEEIEEDMVKRVLLLDDRRVSALMTPRREVVWLDVEDSPDDIRHKIASIGLASSTGFPVIDGDPDNMVGEVQARDLLTNSLQDRPLDLRKLARQPLYVPEVMAALNVLGALREANTEMALVIDEYGSVQGVVTLDDIIESIMSDVSSDSVTAPAVVERDDGSWLVEGMLPIDEFKERFDIDTLPSEPQGYYQTVGGLVTMQMGRIPVVTDRVEWDGFEMEVVDMDGRRVDKVLLTHLPEETEPVAAETEAETEEAAV